MMNMQETHLNLPNTGYCEWSYDNESRVLHANFRKRARTATSLSQLPVITEEDENFLMLMMEKSDITVISEGLADEISAKLWTREYIVGCIGSEYHHEIRSFQFQKTNTENKSQTQYHEERNWYSMTFSSYFDYLDKRRSSQEIPEEGGIGVGGNSERDTSFHFVDSHGKKQNINAQEEALVSAIINLMNPCLLYLYVNKNLVCIVLSIQYFQYMVDVDIPKLLPQCFEDLQKQFKLPKCLPGGAHCMMNAVR